MTQPHAGELGATGLRGWLAYGGATDPYEPDLGNSSGGMRMDRLGPSHIGNTPDPVTLAVVVSGGDPPEPDALSRLRLVDFVTAGRPTLLVAADSGLDHAAALGLCIDTVVGDLDSVSRDALADARARGATVRSHAVRKDATDLELAIRAAIARGARDVVVVGGVGPRLDHLLGTALLLGHPDFTGVGMAAVLGTAVLRVITGSARLTGSPGEYVSLLPLHGTARGVHTRGLVYELRGDDLAAGSSRPLSNELCAREAKVEVEGGTLLAVQPGAR